MSTPAVSALGRDRLLSLDAFRGFTIAGMILVNTPGTWSHVYAPLRHAAWHGCTPTDLVFPFFVFIVGVSMYFSLSKFNHQLSRATSIKILKRTLLIFVVGLLLTWFPFYNKAISDYRIMNVLQRIALAYGAAAFLGILLRPQQLWGAIAVILVGYWGAMWAFGGLDPYTLEDNFARAVDVAILGENHLYGGFGIPFDPEGLFHSIPAVATALLGYQAGRLIKNTPDRNLLVKNLLLWGIGGIALALLWNMSFPINKPLWTSSYVLYTAGIAAVVLGFFMQYYDVQGGRRGKNFLEVFGTNALFAYVLHGLLFKISYHLFRWEMADGSSMHPMSWFYQKALAAVFGDGAFASLLFALLYVLLCWLVTRELYKRRIFIKL